MKAILDGDRPKRPKNAAHLGFTGSIWETVENCWLEDRYARPDVNYVLSSLRGESSKHTGRWMFDRRSGFVFKLLRGVFR